MNDQTYVVNDADLGADGKTMAISWVQDGNQIALSSRGGALTGRELLDRAATVALADPADPGLLTDHADDEMKPEPTTH